MIQWVLAIWSLVQVLLKPGLENFEHYFASMWDEWNCAELTHWKRLWCWEGLGPGGEGDDRMRWLDGITDLMDMSLSELWDGDGQGGLACCDSWGRKESDTTEWLNWTELNRAFFGIAFLWNWNENWLFPVLWPLLSFPNVLAYWAQHFHSLTF